MSKTKIEWADVVWNPVTGCTPISEGCQNCYAKRMAQRLRGRCGYPADDPFRVTLHPERLEEPLRWKKPRKVFVCSMGDIFHEDVLDEWIDQVFAVMAVCKQHTFLVLTKRPNRMKEYLAPEWRKDAIAEQMCEIDESSVQIEEEYFGESGFYDSYVAFKGKWPLPNVWLGVTAENQQMADERIPILLQIPAVVRFVSVEPMLGAVDLTKWFDNTIICDHCGQRFDPSDLSQVFAHMTIPHQPIKQAEYSGSKRINGLHWVICGGETGPDARPMHPDWVRYLRDQCQVANVPFFFKQWGEYEYLRQGLKNGNGKIVAHKVGKKKAGRLLDGREWNEFPKATK